MNIDQPSQKSLDDVLSLVQKLGPEALASQFQEVALDLARQQQNLNKQIANFEQQRHQWDSQRQQSVMDIQEQSSQLADAWLRLEGDRRSLRQAANTSAEAPPPNHDHTQVPPAVARQNHQIRTSGYPETSRGASCTPSLTEQFQLLQRERRAAEASAGKTNGSKRS